MTFRESGRACSRSIGKNTEKSKINHLVQVPMSCIGLHGSFTRIFSSPTAFVMTQRTLSTQYPFPCEPKKERKKERHDIENKKLELFEQAVVAIKAPHPATGDSPEHETNEAHVFGKYVGLTLSKLAPSTFRKAKKCISNLLFEFEEKDELEKANNTSFARNSTQRGFSRADYPSSLSSGLSYSNTSYASASNLTPPGFNPYFYGSTHMQSAEQLSRPSLGVESSHRNQAFPPDFRLEKRKVKVKKGDFSGYPYYVQCICSCKLHD